ncbi:similar to Saccharomyces cerevisiae YDR264C AKR1 Palmitoyl transferase involved in protein palmitoylation [Maudiozyma barnettii]|uniref:Palmitoyltransferase n=1 Tax=Maudiozyma barnettii TaxID=61262 RepID=A0A8H2ZHQ1_9SACH|nr:palmitoyltransferase AKR1 [Kazachstania barnettii]CAB4256014.1 similar to Saccharomyces cerevisiae YDR264C AKR1 Palmitoyl transferase involved in protein palmitoylation [Kazachstania barnettii]CAD1784622.1 similar to Saccharomyces cerevisiae YDR264C AKR1 Palmitoyl transferase involved in protein palmitoylation [Kazachstania barnettii]
MEENESPLGQDHDFEVGADTSSLQAVVSNEATSNVSNTEGQDSQQKLDDTKVTNPILNEYQQACQSGEIVTVKKLVESGAIDIHQDFDPAEKVSGLHWAAINNRLTVVKYLVSQGAEVNCQAEKLHSTPLHWAARYGYVYIVDYLITFGADINLTDDQGFNLLHLAVNSSNIMLVAYVLFFVVNKGLLDINTQDPNGRTSLLWASYQGDSLTVALLLKFGANINLQDSGGFTALHWGVVKGQLHVIKYLIRAGGDFFQKTNDGKDCFVISNELHTAHSLKRALNSCGFKDNGYPTWRLFSEPLYAKFTIFITPLLFIGVVGNLFCVSNPIIWILVSMILGFSLSQFFQRLVLPSFIGSSDASDPLIDYNIARSPLMAGIFFGSLFWVTVVSTLMIVPKMVSIGAYASSTFILISLILSYVTFFKLLNSDPGIKPPVRDQPEIVRNTIIELMKLGKLDTENFCIETWVRKPLRSKYSKFSKGLVSRFDHFCPWVYNDIGLRNHKLFMFFVIVVECGIMAFTYLILESFQLIKNNTVKSGITEDKCFLVGDSSLCYGYHHDKFSFIILMWSILQGSWILFLLIMQSFQVAKGVTSYEFTQYARLAKHTMGSHSHPHSHNHDLETGRGLDETFNTTPEDMKSQDDGNEEYDEENFTTINGEETNNGSTDLLMMQPHGRKSIFGICYRLLGLTQLCQVMKETLGYDPNGSNCNLSLKNTRRVQIPTNYGMRTNVIDFLLTSDKGAPIWERFMYPPINSRALLNGIDVDYFSLYELPVKGQSSSMTV